MAESLSALKKLKEQLICPICLEDYTDPKVLQCMHTFCKGCLESIAEKLAVEGEDLLNMSCPVCRRVTQVSEIGTLQTAFYLESLFDIRKDLEACKEFSLKCVAHGMAADFYCKLCDCFLCSVCTYGAHKEHVFDLISSVAPKEVADIEMRLEKLKSKESIVNEAVVEAERNYCLAQEEERDIQKMIHESFKEAHEILDNREKELVQELRQISGQKLQNLTVEREHLESVGAQLKSCQDVVCESLDIKTAAEVLKMKTALVAMMEDISSHVDRLSIAVKKLNLVAFFANKTALQPLSKFGEVYVKLPYGDNCVVQGKGLSRGKVGSVSAVQLSLYDHHGIEVDVKTAIHTVNANLYLSTDSAKLQCSVEKLDQNQCTVKYQPTKKGPHHLHIDVAGCPVKGSPYCISIKTPLSHICSTPVNIIAGLPLPWGTALDHKQQVCVAVSGRKEVAVFNGHSGEKVLTVVKRGLLQSKMEEPTGIALDKNSNLIITDFRLSIIQRVTLDGQVLQSVGCVGSKAAEFSYPSALAVNPVNDKIYVAEWQDNNRIQILHNDLSHYKMFGRSGSKPGEFLCPSGIAFDGRGNVYVADSNNARIQVFSCEGEYIAEFGKWGKKEGKLGLPMGLCMDRSSDVLYITDAFNHRVSLFTTGGKFLKCFGSHGSGPGEFNKPQGIVVDEFRFVYVSDTHNNRVQVF